MIPRVLILMEASRFDGPVRNLFYALDELKDDASVVFVTFGRRGLPDSDVLQAIRDRGMDSRVIAENHAADPFAFVRFCRTIRELRPDVIQVHNTKSRLFAILGCMLGYWPRHRLVFFFHGETWIDLKQRLYNRLDRFLFRMVPHVVVVTPFQKGLLEGWGVRTERISVIPNAIPEIEIEPAAIQKPYRFMTAGRLSLEKGHDILLMAISLLRRRRGSCFRLHIHGEGPERRNLQQLAERLEIHDLVEFHGYTSDLRASYLKSHLFILPSRSEGMPNVLLEAAMHRVPILATRVGGVPDLFDDGIHAKLVPSEDPLAMSLAIEDFLDRTSVWHERASCAWEHTKANHSPAKKGAALLTLWGQIANSHTT